MFCVRFWLCLLFVFFFFLCCFCCCFIFLYISVCYVCYFHIWFCYAATSCLVKMSVWQEEDISCSMKLFSASMLHNMRQHACFNIFQGAVEALVLRTLFKPWPVKQTDGSQQSRWFFQNFSWGSRLVVVPDKSVFK